MEKAGCLIFEDAYGQSIEFRSDRGRGLGPYLRRWRFLKPFDFDIRNHKAPTVASTDIPTGGHLRIVELAAGIEIADERIRIVME